MTGKFLDAAGYRAVRETKHVKNEGKRKMSEEKVETQEQAQPSFGELLGEKPVREPQAEVQSEEQPSEPVEPQEPQVEAAEQDIPPVEEAQTEEPKEPEQAVAEEKPQEPVPNHQVNGLLSAVQAERKRRQEAEARLAQYEGDYQMSPQQEADNNAALADPRIVDMSEQMARLAHPDYDEKFTAFSQAVAQNPSLYEQVMSSNNPGEAAYKAGELVMYQQQYGSADVGQILAKAKKQIEAELTPKIRKQVEQQFTDRLNDKASTPTNILSARSASTEPPDDSYRSPSWGDVLGNKQGRAKQFGR